jgi:hypothetical protein
MTLHEILDRYPIQSSLPWMRHEDNTFSIDASDFQSVPDTEPLPDPWGRPIPLYTGIVRDREGEIQYWNYQTTLAGNPITLIVFND